MSKPHTETTPDDDPYNEFLWGGDFDERQEAELDRKNTRVSSMTEPTQTTERCGICGGTGLVSQEFFDRCQSDGLHCLPAGTRCYCTVTADEIVAELPSLIKGILDRSLNDG